MRVKVPASIANIGPGFDCMAMAIDLWLEAVANESERPAWDYEGEGGLAGRGVRRRGGVNGCGEGAAGARDHAKAPRPAGWGAARPPAPAAPAPPLSVGGRGDPCRRGRGRLRRGDLRRGAERVRVLRAVASREDCEGDGGFASTARPRPGDEDHRQRHVPPPVIVQKYGGTSVSSAARIRP